MVVALWKIGVLMGFLIETRAPPIQINMAKKGGQLNTYLLLGVANYPMHKLTFPALHVCTQRRFKQTSLIIRLSHQSRQLT